MISGMSILNNKFEVLKAVDIEKICPYGYDFLSKSDLEIFNKNNKNYRILIDNLKIKENSILMSKSKSNNETNPMEYNYWNYYALDLKDQKMNLFEQNIYN